MEVWRQKPSDRIGGGGCGAEGETLGYEGVKSGDKRTGEGRKAVVD